MRTPREVPFELHPPMSHGWRFHFSVMGVGENQLMGDDTWLSDLDIVTPWDTYQGVIWVNGPIGKLPSVRLNGRL